METSHYMNSPADRRMERVTTDSGKSKIYLLIGVFFFLLCVTQSILNAYFWYQSVGTSKGFNVSVCNVTLLEEIREVLSERDQLLKQEDQHLGQIDQLLQEKKELLEKNKQLHQGHIELHNNVQQLKEEKRELLQNKVKLEDKMTKLRQRNRLLKNENSRLNQEKNQLLYWKEQIQKEKDELVKEKNDLIQIELKLTEQNGKLRQEKCQLQQEKDLLKIQIKNLEEKLAEKENQISELQKRLNTEVTSQSCPPGWLRFMSSCYQLSTEPNTWIYAKQNCETKGAQLMILNDETEQRPFIGGMVKIWIGLYVETDSYTSCWNMKDVNGRLLKYSASNTPKPKFWTGLSQSCVYIDQSLPCMSSWSTGTCREKFYWICEKQMSTTGV
ncbi:C-type lectin domain family 4 member G-like [Cyprinodon tularosa]|uniref:C-type lectin domain family 4 member G-like n=1 Tax=Cyprinodon tularosa TaxID=77115 RepID=UPI0018E1E920|nr:C-type lectin domain family 4 member G-like [Cyprinodon tularosa]